ncbi:Aldose 1-/Glucose-6-phosphate 1-epimerase [Trypanosoma melophagium]|uniref:Aldose 1-/Glucose-6-phosphate 1-epimerase n=1 Tax=Trypanosoma melophagium TaxID=715481 RepID=UPI00351A1837|nr:Aldose 1-/Glucose-6-phosphate 1-epimerase [Trypanosoma melophagium]KAH9593485.1 Aldose 1-/Glucose-6-phosphate 1-epimerase [Trypanosoma melophagium]KAH9593513.1 Aldose 1-/Glucose-6-phosphate 1-epimerase [Trypanosoma melophagium]
MEAHSAKEYRSHVEPFGDGSKVTLISPDLRVALLTKGATLHSVQYRVPLTSPAAAVADKDGWVELTLGYDTPEEFEEETSYMGRTCGRFAGRIENGEILLDGKSYKLLQNEGKNTLHGGPDNFAKRQWKYLLLDGEEEIGISFHLSSPHLDQGFPGEVFVTATYSIVKNRPATLKWNLQAVLSDASPVNSTTVNMCNHAYWNLNGVPSSSSAPRHLPDNVLNHHLQLHSRYVAETNALIPTGLMREVEGTPHDFRQSRPILEGVQATEKEGRDPPGYDDPVALETWDSKLREAAVVFSPKTHIAMIVETTSPSVVVYTANHLPKDASGGSGERFQRYSGICLETQYFPNSPNIPSFPSTVITKNEKYDETTTCRFKIVP